MTTQMTHQPQINPNELSTQTIQLVHWRSYLFERVDIAFLVLFRIAFGAVMLWHIWEYFNLGVIKADYIDPPFHFTWYWFDWVKPLPGPGMYLLYYTMGILAACIMIGLHYRISCLLFSVLFTYCFLIDKAYYLNHYYLTCLVSLLMAFVPAHRTLSVDAWIRPTLKSQTAPRWALWLMRFQIGIPYFYGGLAKLQPDWLQCQPMKIALSQRADRFPYLGQFFTEDWMVWFFNYGGLIFDLSIVPLLLWRKTRIPAFLAALFFHCMNSVMFDIGYFPWFMIFATTLFFEPNWPRRVINFFWCGLGGRAIAKSSIEPSTSGTALTPLRRWGSALLIAYVLAQLAIPFRHYFYPGNVSWTEEGHCFAWHMMLRGKYCGVRYYATDPETRQTMVIDLRPFLTTRQMGKLGKDPHMVHDLALFLKKELTRDGHPNMEIRCLDLVSMNGRKPQLLVDPQIDLAKFDRIWRRAPWLIELRESLRDPAWLVPIVEWEQHLDMGQLLEGTPMSPTKRKARQNMPSGIVDDNQHSVARGSD